MIIFKDRFTGDEFISDSYKMTEKNGVAYEIDCKRITKKDENDFDIGANASAEDAGEALESESRTVVDVVDAFNLASYTDPNGNKFYGTFKEFRTYFGGYVKKLKTQLKEEGLDDAAIKEFEKGVNTQFVDMMGGSKGANYGDWDLYRGESDYGGEGMLALMNYREDGVTPYLVVWKHGLKEEKV